MRLFLALRLFRDWHAKCGIEAVSKAGIQRGHLISLHAERHHPAFKNITEYLRDKGKLPAVRRGEVFEKSLDKAGVKSEADCRIYWCEVETDLPVEEWEAKREVEAWILKDDFEQLVTSIRYRSGVAYVKACEEFAENVKTTLTSPFGYHPPKVVQGRAA